MSSTTTTHRHPLPIGGGRERSRDRAVPPIPSRLQPRLAPEPVDPTMGRANRPPGTPVMGGATFAGYANVMGEVGAQPGVSVMGAGDRGIRTDLFGDSDAAFVGLLFGR